LSILYSQNAFFDEAAVERDEAIAMAVDQKSHGHLISFYFNAATDARKQGHTQAQIENFKKAVYANTKTESPDVYIPMIYSGLISAYSSQGNIELAKSWITKLEANPEKYTEGINRDSYLWGLKNLSFAEEDYRKTPKQY